MELLIKQRVFSWTDSYDVYDEEGLARYFVKAEFFSFGHQIHLYDKQTGRELGSVHQKLLTLMPTYEIVVDGASRGLVRKKFTFFSEKYELEYMGWNVDGDFLGWDYRVYQQGRKIMEISKELLHWGDTYRIRFQNPADELAGLLLVIAIDAANCSHND